MKSEWLRNTFTTFIPQNFEPISEAMGKNGKGYDCFMRLWHSRLGFAFCVELMLGTMNEKTSDYSIEYHFFESLEDLGNWLYALEKYPKGYGKIVKIVDELVAEAAPYLSKII